MKLTNTKRALMGAAAVLILGAVITYRNAGRAFTERDYLLIGAALVLVTMNVIGSYYFDRKAAQEAAQGKTEGKKKKK
jgi:hypothetical protein